MLTCVTITKVKIGHFENAITSQMYTFRDSLPLIEEEPAEHKVLKICNVFGNWRYLCHEKASAYFKHKGFQKVYQLEGGIIEYARQVKDHGLDNKFKGKNFVFDERRGERITDG